MRPTSTRRAWRSRRPAPTSFSAWADFAENYRRSGGRAALSDYFVARGACATIVPFLKQRILFCDHSLATDAAFAEMHLISCRNVLIYFDKALQDRVIGVFRESLCPRGFLGLGPE